MLKYWRILLPKKIIVFAALFILGAAICRAEDQLWKFAKISDTQANTSQWGKAGADLSTVNVRICEEIAGAIAREKVDLVIVAGDLVNRQSVKRGDRTAYKIWQEAMSPIYQAGIPVYPLRGNHDAAGSVALWKNAFGTNIPDNGPADETGLTYFVTNKNALFIGLDVFNTNHPARINQEWLDKVLAKNKLPHVFVFAHEPAFKLLQSDCLGAHPEERNKFWDSMKRAGARVYFSGHDHVFDHARIDDGDGNPDNDVHQLVGGPAGAMLDQGGVYDGKNAPYLPKQISHDETYGYIIGEIKGPEVKVVWKHRTDSNTYEQAATWSYTVTNSF